MSKSYEALVDIAKEMNVEYNKHSTAEEISYAILDEQAELEGNKNPLGSRRQRARATKVYSSNEKKPQSNAPQKPKEKKTKEQPTPTALQPLFAPASAPAAAAPAPVVESPAASTSTYATPEEELAAIPKHRGRRTKREIELMAIIKEQKSKAQPSMAPADKAEESKEESKAAAGESPVTDLDDITAALLKKSAPAPADSVWAGDPGDGTDFIAVVDVPIEDPQLSPTYDIFDNPYYNHNEPANNQYHQEMIEASPAAESYEFDDLITCNGVAEILSDGFGFLRSSDYNYLSSPDDVYVPQPMVKKYGIKTGDVVQGKVRPPKENEQYFALTSIALVNGKEPNEMRDRIAFEHLTPLFPDEKFNLCGDKSTTNMSTRMVDLFSPIGKGQRALIVAQPKTGKTILMKDIANAIAANHPEAYLMMLLIDERPEEVTDMARTVNAEVIASTFDEPADRHVKIAGIVLEKAKRLVECGHDVVIFLDSITRLARAYNTVAPASGKVLTGGVDANALQKPKRFFGAARNIEGGGSLTIIATALIDTGSKMDEVIFEEFKGTGNMELQLDRTLSNKRVFPSLNLVASSTRRDDLLQDETTLRRMWIVRNHISDMTSMEAMDTIRKCMERTRDNDEFFAMMNS